MMRHVRTLAGFAAMALSAAFVAVPQAKADYPDKTIRFIVPFPAGGSSDIAARIVGDHLSKRLGATIVIDNQPGANGLIGASAAVRAKPDGYTLLVTSNGIHSAAATGTANFDLKADLVPVSEMVGGAFVLVGSKQAPFADAKGFVEHARKNKDKVSVAINAALGVAHLSFENFRRMVGIDYVPIYYPGEAPSLAALVSGESAVGIATVPSARPFIEGDKVNALAVTTAERYAGLPDVPTLGETVAPGFAGGYSIVMFAPKGTPGDIVERLSREIAEIVKGPEAGKRLSDLGLLPIASAPAEYAKVVATEFDQNVKLIKELREQGLVNQ